MPLQNPKLAESGGSGSDAYPGEGPQAIEDFNFRDFHSPIVDDLNLSMEEPVEKELKFIFANGEFKVSPSEDHQQMAQNAGIRPDYQGPMAVGHINLQGKDALWSVESNIGLQGLVKRMKAFSKAQNWDFGGLVDSTGNPIHDDFLPKKSYWYGWRDGELKLSRHPFWEGDNKIEVKARIAHFDKPPNPFALDGLEEWAADFGYRIAGDYVSNPNPEWQGMPNEPYHAAPTSDRERIRAHGLQPSQPHLNPIWTFDEEQTYPEGIYGHPTLEDARNQAQWMEQKTGQSHDIWRIPPRDMTTLLPDPEEGSWVTQYPVPNPEFIEGPENRIASYPGGGDMNDKIKNKEWIQQYDKGNPEADPGKAFEGEPQGEMTCPYCNEILSDFKAYQMHTKNHQDPEMQPIDDGHFPTIGPLDEPLGFGTQSVPTAIPLIGSTKQQDDWSIVTPKGWQFEAEGSQEGKDLLQSPIPFVYDVEKDQLVMGHPGMNAHDVMPQGEGATWTPNGVCEGLYEPGGRMVIKTTTTIPFSTYHLMQLFYHSHPGLEITSLELESPSGESQKVA